MVTPAAGHGRLRASHAEFFLDLHLLEGQPAVDVPLLSME
jgi:hypothetical protein